MSRNHSKTSRGRQNLMAPPRLNKTKTFADDTYQESVPKRNKKSKYVASVQQTKRRRVAASPSSSESSDDLDAEDASDEQSEDDEDADDLPAVGAPSHHDLMTETGPLYAGVSRAGSVESMFGENGVDFEKQNLPTLEDMRRFEEDLFAAASDDDAYAAVEDISDSDEEETNHFEEQQLIADLSDDGELEELDLLNQIDGMSAYGFGDESDATAAYPPSSQGSDSATEMGPPRHVHFNVDPAHAFNPSLVDSPTFSRALLPSALPNSSSLGHVGIRRTANATSSDGEADGYDSDATDDCLPPEAEFHNDDEEEIERQHSPSLSRTDSRQRGDCKGPPRGIFIDEGTKTTGILDKTGKIMIITHPHLLGDEFARRYGNSTASSPAIGFEELLSESDFADDAPYNNVTPATEMDLMLNNANSVDVNGIVTGPQEAFYPPGFNLGDFTEDFELDEEDGDDLGEDVINLDDVIQFDDDTDDSEAPNSPFFATPKATAQNRMWAPSSSTVTAFRRHQDSFKTTPSFTRFSELSSPASAINPRKRKSTMESPYASEHYKGVTPVQRMTKNGNALPSTPDTVRAKRQRMMTV